MFCKNCGNHLPENATFCEACWTPLQYPEQEQMTKSKVSTESKVLSVVSYFTWIAALIVGLLKRDDSLVKYHANVSLSLTIDIIVYYVLFIAVSLIATVFKSNHDIYIALGSFCLLLLVPIAWSFLGWLVGVIFAILGKEKKLLFVPVFKFFK